MKGTERYLAFIIEQTHITAVEVAHGPRGKTLTAAGSFESSINFDDPEVYNEAGMATREKTFVKEIQSFMKNIGAGAHFFSFGLNSKMATVHSIPVEQSLTDDEFAIHLEWELKNLYHEANLEQFVVLPYALVNDQGEPGNDAMIITVRKSFLNFLTIVSERLNGSLHIVDVDHFCAESCLTHTFPEITSKRTVVIGLDEDTIDASLLVNGKNAHIQTMKRNSTDLSVIDQYARNKRAETIFLHGRIVTQAMADELKQLTPYPVELSDPFRKIALPAALKNVEELKAKRQEFTAAVGLAIREE